MKIEATVKQVIEDGGELSITLRGWFESEPSGTLRHPLGTINLPSTKVTRRSYYIGRRIFIEVKPA